MPLGVPGFPRDPVSGDLVGIARSILGSKKDSKKDTASAITSWKQKEAEREARPSTDTLPAYTETKSSKTT